MKLCSRCKKRPAVVFLADASTPGSEPQGLCLVCAKELGIKPVDDMLKRMNISDEDIEPVSYTHLNAKKSTRCLEHRVRRTHLPLKAYGL